MTGYFQVYPIEAFLAGIETAPLKLFGDKIMNILFNFSWIAKDTLARKPENIIIEEVG